MLYRNILLALCCTVLAVYSCERESKYERIVKGELAKGVRHDSLFLGYKLGMPRDEFYDYSWKLNKKHLVRQGPGNLSIEYELDKELPHPGTMNFYPDFKDQKIHRMRVLFSYDGWAPWNDNLGADSLIFDVKKLMEKWYGTGFFEIEKPQMGTSFVKIDGNREILIFKADETRVNVFFTDLTAIKEDSNPGLNFQ